MTEDTGQTEGTSQQRIAELERGVDDASQQLAVLLHQQKVARTQTLVATLVILVIIIVFGWNLYRFVTTTFTEDKVMQVVNDKKDDLIGKAKLIAKQAQDEVVPVYKETLIATAKELVPQLEIKAREELMALEANIKGDLTDVINITLKRLEDALQNDMEQKFPFVVKDREPADVFAAFLDTLEKQGPAVQASIDKVIHEEGQRVQDVIVKFPVRSDLDKVDRSELELQLVRMLLQYADYEASVAGTDDALDFGSNNFWSDTFSKMTVK